MTETDSLYERAGGSPFFDRLVARFYEGVAADPVLRAVYPEADLAPAQHRLTLFLIQYWGGPRTYDTSEGTLASGCDMHRSRSGLPSATGG